MNLDGTLTISDASVILPANAYRIKLWTNAEVDASFADYQHDSKPEIRRRLPSPKLGSGENRTNVSGWEPYFMAINYNDERRYNYVTNIKNFCFNSTGLPQMASVDTAGNIVLVERIQDGFAKLQTLILSDGVPDVAQVNYKLTPWFVHKLNIVHRDYRRLDVPDRGDCYYPVVLNGDKEAWMPVEWLIKL